jgi:transcription-repair coupling factor (superfamily II helicase)
VDVLLLPARALLTWLPSPPEIAAASRVIRVGDTLPPDTFLLDALRSGYRRAETVAAPGEVSRRGGIVDIFPPEADEPVRIELFGDTVESLRAFDPDHQRSTGALARVAIGPAAENPASDAAVTRLAAYLEGGAARARAEDGPVLGFRAKLDTPSRQRVPSGLRRARVADGRGPRDALRARARAPARRGRARTRGGGARPGRLRAPRLARREWEPRPCPPPPELFVPEMRIVERLRAAPVALRELETGEAAPGERRVAWPSRRARGFAGRVADLAEAWREQASRGETTLCVVRAEGGARRLREILTEYELASEPSIRVVLAPLREGFELPEEKLVVLAERELFGEERHAADRKSKGRTAFLSDFRDLKIGDLVVHVDHGIARYAGLGRPKGGSQNRDFMILEFQRGDRLFVPTDRLDLVQKYSGVAGHKPPLDRLGGTGWEKVKSRVRSSVESMAKELLELYARRRAASGHAFAADGPWQAELEAAFFRSSSPPIRSVR